MSRRRVRLPSAGIEVTIEHRADRGTWHLDWKRSGVRHRPRLATTKSAAIAEADRFVSTILRRGAGGLPLIHVAAHMLLHKRRVGRAEGTLTAMKSHLRAHIFPALGKDTPIDHIDAQMLRDLMYGLVDVVDLKSANRVHSTVSQIFAFAADRGICERPKLPKRFPERASDNAHAWTIVEPPELKKLFKHVDAEVRPAIVFLANTGIRVGSALATRKKWVDLPQGIVRYPAAVVKQRRAFVQTLNAEATRALRIAMERSRDEDVFPFSYWLLRRRFMTACDEAEVELTIKDLRHSMVSNMLAAGEPIHVVREVMGHSSIQVTSLYAHAQDAAKRAAVASVAVSADLPVPPDATSRATKRRRSSRTRKPAGKLPAGSRGVTPVGHKGLEPLANGLRIHCSTD